jgi:Glycosyltransferases involved in cell wall biogenesis
MAPKVSICIPAYLQKDLLLRTLDSVFAQDYTDFEVIVTDDSPDRNIEEALRAHANGAKVTYVRNRERMGSPANWNEAVRLAKGEYVKILHHDDWFNSKASLGAYVAALDGDRGSDFAFSAARVHDVSTGNVYLHTANARQLRDLRRHPGSLFQGNFIGAPSATIFRRKSFVPFDTNLKWVVDMDFYLQMLFRNPQFCFLPEPLVCTTAGSPHQVTTECAGDKGVVLFEWLYLYCKTAEKRRVCNTMFRTIRELIARYDVRSVDEFRFQAAPYPVPTSVRAMVWLRSLRTSAIVR